MELARPILMMEARLGWLSHLMEQATAADRKAAEYLSALVKRIVLAKYQYSEARLYGHPAFSAVETGIFIVASQTGNKVLRRFAKGLYREQMETEARVRELRETRDEKIRVIDSLNTSGLFEELKRLTSSK